MSKKKKNPHAVALGNIVKAKYGTKHYRRIGKIGASNRRTEVAELAEREGISRQAAWYRLRRATGKPKGRPRKAETQKRTKGESQAKPLRINSQDDNKIS